MDSSLAHPEGVQAAQEALASASGLGVALVTSDGCPVTPPAGRPEFCRRMLELAPHRCQASMEEAARWALRSRRPETTRCHAGLTYLAIPVPGGGDVQLSLLLGNVAESAANGAAAVERLRRFDLAGTRAAIGRHPAPSVRSRAELDRWRPLGKVVADYSTAFFPPRAARGGGSDALIDLARLFASPLDLIDGFTRVVDRVVDAFEADACCALLPEEADGTLRALAARGVPAHRQAAFRWPRGTHPPAKSFLPSLSGETWRTTIDLPLGGPGDEGGYLCVGWRRRAPGAAELEALEAVATIGGALVRWASVVAERTSVGEEIVAALGLMLQTRDPRAYAHARQVATNCEMLARAMRLPEHEVTRFRQAGFLHDIGKVALPPATLKKARGLTGDEAAVLRRHPAIGAAIVGAIGALESLAPIVRHHHERHDGNGYPAGLSGEGIPLGARVVAVAEAFDAMVRDQPYHPARPVAEALVELRAGAGGQFDPVLVDLFEVEWRRSRPHEAPAPRAEFARAGTLLPHLTPREREVLGLLGRGLTNRELAAALVLSTKTVKTHVSSILQKLGLSDRTKAAVFAIEYGLTPELREERNGPR